MSESIKMEEEEEEGVFAIDASMMEYEEDDLIPTLFSQLNYLFTSGPSLRRRAWEALTHWSYGINRQLYTSIRSSRITPFPASHRSVFMHNLVHFPLSLPLHSLTDPTRSFAKLPYKLKAWWRNKQVGKTITGTSASVNHAVAIGNASFSGLVSAAPASIKSAGHITSSHSMGAVDGYAWDLFHVGVALSHNIPAHVVRMWKNDGLDLNMPLSKWGQFVVGYRNFWSSLPSFNPTHTNTWMLYCKHVLRINGSFAQGVKLILFESPHSNSFAHLRLIIQFLLPTRSLASATDDQIKMARNTVLMLVYLVCFQFWLFCNDRFLVRTASSDASFGVDRPPFLFIFNLEKDLPKKSKVVVVTADSAILSSGQRLVEFAQLHAFSSFACAILRSPPILELIQTCGGKEDAPKHVDLFITNHITANREKVLVSRKFTLHSMNSLVTLVNEVYSNVIPQAPMPSGVAITDTLSVVYSQHPSADKSNVKITKLVFNSVFNEKLGPVIPHFMSHVFFSPNAPILSMDPHRTQASVVSEQEAREIRWSVSHSAHHASLNVYRGVNSSIVAAFALSAAELTADITLRSTLTCNLIYCMQVLPFLNRTDVKNFDCCIARYYKSRESKLVACHVAFQDQCTPSGPSFQLRELPSAASCHSLSSIPRTYDPIVPVGSQSYTCYPGRLEGGSSSLDSLPRLFRYIREFECIPQPFQMCVGDHHILSMSLDTWLWLGLKSEAQPKADLINRIKSEADSVCVYITGLCLDAWDYFKRDNVGSEGAVDYLYGLYVFLSYFVGVESELVGSIAVVMGISVKDVNRMTMLFNSIQVSATRLFKNTIHRVFASGVFHPFRVTSLFSMWSGEIDTPFSSFKSNIPYTFERSRLIRETQMVELYQFGVRSIESGSVPMRSVIREIELVVTKMTHCDSESYPAALNADNIHLTWDMVVIPNQAIHKLYSSSTSFRSSVDHVLSTSMQKKWVEGPMTIKVFDFIALSIIVLNAVVFDTISVLMDFLLPISLIGTEAKPLLHWSQSVERINQLDQFDVLHASMDRQVDMLAERVDEFLIKLNMMHDLTNQDLVQWAQSQKAYTSNLHSWIVAQGRYDPNASRVIALHNRVNVILGESNASSSSDVSTHSLHSQLEVGSPMPNPQPILQFVVRLVNRLVKYKDDNETSNLFAVDNYYTRLLYELAVATGNTDPMKVRDLLREIICMVKQDNPILSNILTTLGHKPNSNPEIRAMLLVGTPNASSRGPIVHTSTVRQPISSLLSSSSSVAIHSPH